MRPSLHTHRFGWSRWELISLGIACFLIACGEEGSQKPTVTTTAATSSDARFQTAGDLLLARSNCIACHSADNAVIARVGSLRAPRLDNIGRRISTQWISQYLASGSHTGATGMRMPNLMHGLAPEAKQRTVRELTAYLSSLRAGPACAPITTTRPSQMQAGEKLWKTVGCATCHAAVDENWLAKKWNASELTSFLQDPSAVWPDGQMPAMNLSSDEAQAIAAWLLRGQACNDDGSLALTKAPGVAVDYFEGDFQGVGPSATDVPTQSAFVENITLPSFVRADAWGLRFAATLTIPTTGDWTFIIGSDDGSSLSIDGELIADNPGVHGMDWKQGTRALTAGPHEILVTYFEGAGDSSLAVKWQGPNVDRQTIPSSAFTREAIELRSPSRDETSFATADIAAGRALFARLGCVQCHSSTDRSSATDTSVARIFKPLLELDLARGCLAIDPQIDVPDYDFQPRDRDALRELLSNAKSLSTPLAASDSLALHMLGLNCTACHSRQDVGQPTADALALFTGTADLGEQGRVPPTLTGAGAKLRTSAIATILAGNGRVRPYLLTRMPRFGATASAPLPALFATADRAPRDEPAVAISPELVAAGMRLAGADGLSCITCHGISGYPSLGVPAIDLSYTYARLRPSWFTRYMKNPSAIDPGTRMPTFWLPDQRIQTDVCGGDAAKQIDALWTYLSLGSSMPLPKGLVAGNEFALAPTERPIVLGTFMDGLSARCFAVGFPEQIHYVYDADHRRTAKAWRGKFMDAAGTWFGRAGLLCQPAGIDVLDFPPNDSIAVLTTAQNAWPTVAGRQAGWIFLGNDRDAAGVPTFRTQGGAADLYIEERIAPVAAIGGAHLVRDFVIRAKSEPKDVFVRAWIAQSIASTTSTPGTSGWTADNGPTIFVSGGPAFVRTIADADATQSQSNSLSTRELLVPVGFRTGSDSQRPYEARIRLEYVW